MSTSSNLKIAFMVGEFPHFGPYVIDQVAGLLDQGVTVQVYSLHYGDGSNVTDLYYRHHMERLVRYLDMPKNWLARVALALPKLVKIVLLRPHWLPAIFNFKKYGANAYSLRLIFWLSPWLGRENDFNLIHCHFGTVANKFLIIREIIGLKQPLITTFYGYDASHILKQKGAHYYDKLIRESEAFIVMSTNMKERLVAYGFPAGKIQVLPVSIPVDEYPFRERQLTAGQLPALCSVGRFVEKKGFDDLLRAINLVQAARPGAFTCEIIGGGPLEADLKAEATALGLNETVKFLGYKKIEEIVPWLLTKDLFIQPSKTARDGDME